MPESFIPVWMSIGEAEEFRRFLQEEARSTDGEFPEREFSLIDGALEEEVPRTFDQVQVERSARSHLATLESIQGDAYLWQIGEGPWASAEALIEHLRKQARAALDAVNANGTSLEQPASTQPLDLDAKDGSEFLKVPTWDDAEEVEALAKEYAEWSSDKPWAERHPNNQAHWRKVARVLLVAQAEGFPRSQTAPSLDALKERLTSDEVVERATAKRFNDFVELAGLSDDPRWDELNDEEKAELRKDVLEVLEAVAAAFPDTEQGDA